MTRRTEASAPDLALVLADRTSARGPCPPHSVVASAFRASPCALRLPRRTARRPRPLRLTPPAIPPRLPDPRSARRADPDARGGAALAVAERIPPMDSKPTKSRARIALALPTLLLALAGLPAAGQERRPQGREGRGRHPGRRIRPRPRARPGVAPGAQADPAQIAILSRPAKDPASTSAVWRSPTSRSSRRGPARPGGQRPAGRADHRRACR